MNNFRIYYPTDKQFEEMNFSSFEEALKFAEQNAFQCQIFQNETQVAVYHYQDGLQYTVKMQTTQRLFNKQVEVYTGNESDFKKEWTDAELKQVERTIFNFFFDVSVYVSNEKRAFTIYTSNVLEVLFGLPYTSSGAFAGLWNTNSEVYLQSDGQILNDYSIQGFLLSNQNEVVCYTTDTQEKEFYFIIGKI